ncbi:MAG: hypothetical protein J6Y53_03275 [Alphaproteobacteria bacterium]|nr:hypothetical protein [Alphaproteobacteria bacterium]
MKKDKIDYDKLIETSLKQVVIEALKIVEEQGLPGEHHFYISFRTDHPKTKIDSFLKNQYPQEMMIVLQNQFENLKVNEDSFSVVLHFNHVPYRIEIPFDSITYFGDPSVRFGLSFGAEIAANSQPQQAEVVSIDSFRKKNA